MRTHHCRHALQQRMQQLQGDVRGEQHMRHWALMCVVLQAGKQERGEFARCCGQVSADPRGIEAVGGPRLSQTCAGGMGWCMHGVASERCRQHAPSQQGAEGGGRGLLAVWLLQGRGEGGGPGAVMCSNACQWACLYKGQEH